MSNCAPPRSPAARTRCIDLGDAAQVSVHFVRAREMARLGITMARCTLAALVLALPTESFAQRFPPAGGYKPVLGDWSKPVLTADNNTWEFDAVQEPQVIFLPELKLLRMWYRGAGWGHPSGLGVADSTDNGKTWIKHPSNPVWGGNRPNTEEAGGQPWVYRETPDKYWLYTTTNSNPPRVLIATSPDGINWKNCSDGPYVNRSHVPSPRGGSVTGTLFGNRAVWKEAEGKWFMLQECGTSEGVWEIFLYTGRSALEWEVGNGGNPLKTLQRHTRSMFGGCHIATVDGQCLLRTTSAFKSGHLSLFLCLLVCLCLCLCLSCLSRSLLSLCLALSSVCLSVSVAYNHIVRSRYAPKNSDGLYTIWYRTGPLSVSLSLCLSVSLCESTRCID